MFVPVIAVQLAILGICGVYLLAFRDPATPTRLGQSGRLVSAPHRASAPARATKTVRAGKSARARNRAARSLESRKVSPAREHPRRAVAQRPRLGYVRPTSRTTASSSRGRTTVSAAPASVTRAGADGSGSRSGLLLVIAAVLAAATIVAVAVDVRVARRRRRGPATAAPIDNGGGVHDGVSPARDAAEPVDAADSLRADAADERLDDAQPAGGSADPADDPDDVAARAPATADSPPAAVDAPPPTPANVIADELTATRAARTALSVVAARAPSTDAVDDFVGALCRAAAKDVSARVIGSYVVLTGATPRRAAALAATALAATGSSGEDIAVGIAGSPRHGRIADTLLRLAEGAAEHAAATRVAVCVADAPDDDPWDKLLQRASSMHNGRH